MKRNALFPYILIMVFGVGLIFALSLIGLIQEMKKQGEKDSNSALSEATPEEIYSQSCFHCHGENYEGVSAGTRRRW